MYDTFKDLFLHICEIKLFVIKLELQDLVLFKKEFYSQDFKIWRLDLLWEFIFDDISYEELEYILRKSKSI